MPLTQNKFEAILIEYCGQANPFKERPDGSLARIRENAAPIMSAIADKLEVPEQGSKNTLEECHPDIVVLNENFMVIQALLEACSTGQQTGVKNERDYRVPTQQECENAIAWNAMKRKTDKLIGKGQPNTWLVLSKNQTHGRLELHSRVFPAMKRPHHIEPLGIDLSHTNLSGANMNSVHLPYASLVCCILDGVTFNGAKLNGADFRLSRLKNNVFYRCDFTNVNFAGVQYKVDELDHRTAVNHNMRGLDSAYGADTFIRDLKDQSYIDSLKYNINRRYESYLASKNDKKVVNIAENPPCFCKLENAKAISLLIPYLVFILPFHLVYLLCKSIIFKERYEETKPYYETCLFHAWSLIGYGRNIVRTALIGLGVAFVFSLIYTTSGLVDYSSEPNFRDLNMLTRFLTSFYYSIVTFTTLGFGDITPESNGWLGKLVVIWEVVLGYINLGLLVSILANKVARRA